MNLQALWLNLLLWLTRTFQQVPSGNDSQHAKAYYNYLQAAYLNHILGNRTDILWTGPFWIAFFATIMILFFYFYTRKLLSTHREKGEMYGAASFAGSILERIGPVSLFTWLISGVVTLWAIYFIVIHLLFGQLYYGVLYY